MNKKVIIFILSMLATSLYSNIAMAKLMFSLRGKTQTFNFREASSETPKAYFGFGGGIDLGILSNKKLQLSLSADYIGARLGVPNPLSKDAIWGLGGITAGYYLKSQVFIGMRAGILQYQAIVSNAANNQVQAGTWQGTGALLIFGIWYKGGYQVMLEGGSGSLVKQDSASEETKVIDSFALSLNWLLGGM